MQNVSGDNGKCLPLALFSKERAAPDTILVYIYIYIKLQIGCRNQKHVYQTNKITIIIHI
jgi:hypothetical protein